MCIFYAEYERVEALHAMVTLQCLSPGVACHDQLVMHPLAGAESRTARCILSAEHERAENLACHGQSVMHLSGGCRRRERDREGGGVHRGGAVGGGAGLGHHRAQGAGQRVQRPSSLCCPRHTGPSSPAASSTQVRRKPHCYLPRCSAPLSLEPESRLPRAETALAMYDTFSHDTDRNLA